MQTCNSLHNHSAKLLQACVRQFRYAVGCNKECGGVTFDEGCVELSSLSPPLLGESNGLLIKDQVR